MYISKKAALSEMKRASFFLIYGKVLSKMPNENICFRGVTRIYVKCLGMSGNFTLKVPCLWLVSYDIMHESVYAAECL